MAITIHEVPVNCNGYNFCHECYGITFDLDKLRAAVRGKKVIKIFYYGTRRIEGTFCLQHAKKYLDEIKTDFDKRYNEAIGCIDNE